MSESTIRGFGQASRLRLFLLLIYLLGVIGAAAELLLSGHTEDWRQLVPLVLMLFSLLALAFHALARRTLTLRLFQATMFLFVISGTVGCWFHYQAKREFKLETSPSLAGWELFREAMLSGTVPPVLAPAMMIQLGLIGLAYGYCRSSSLSDNQY